MGGGEGGVEGEGSAVVRVAGVEWGWWWEGGREAERMSRSL